MREVRFGRDATLTVPAEPPSHALSNLALDLLAPITRVQYEGEDFICRLDSGANATEFYEPFYRAHRERIERLGALRTLTTAGVGAKRELRAYTMPALELGVGRTTLTLESASVFTESLRDDPENYLYCNVGQDVLGRFDSYVINFVSMTFLLE